MFDLGRLAKYAAEGITMRWSPLLAKQCEDFAAYIDRVKWHHTVREEAKALKKLFRTIAEEK